MVDMHDFDEGADTHVGDLDLPSSESLSDPSDHHSDGSGTSPAPMDPLAVVGSDDVGDQVVQILEELRVRARGLKQYGEQLVDQVEGMRELVLSLSSEGLARRELEERLAVLEAERDVLARQLGKVRREYEEQLSIARERIKDLETELSLTASGRGDSPFPAEARAAESRDSSALIGEPVVETVGAAQRRETLKSRPSRTPTKEAPRPPRFPLDSGSPRREPENETPVPAETDAVGWGFEDSDTSEGTSGFIAGEAAAALGGTAPSEREDSFAGLLDDAADDELEGSFAALIDDGPPREDDAGHDEHEGGTNVGEMPSLPDGFLELEGTSEDGEPVDAASARPSGRDRGPKDPKTSAPSVTLALEDLLSSYLDEEA